MVDYECSDEACVPALFLNVEKLAFFLTPLTSSLTLSVTIEACFNIGMTFGIFLSFNYYNLTQMTEGTYISPRPRPPNTP